MEAAMTEYQILCYRDSFDSYKEIANDITRAIPARDEDEFALLVCVNNSHKIGFDSCGGGALILGELAKHGYSLIGKKLVNIDKLIPGYSSRYICKPKGEALKQMIQDHEKFEIEQKRYQLMTRYGRLCEEPTPAALTAFLCDNGHPISDALYMNLLQACHYVMKEVRSGEHGSGAFEVFSDNLDSFFLELNSLMGNSGELIFVDHSKIPYD
jgi:hypothetical protein